MQLKQAIIALALGTSFASANEAAAVKDSVTIQYYEAKGCKGKGIDLTVDANICKNQVYPIKSFKVKSVKGNTKPSFLSFYINPEGCLGPIVNQYANVTTGAKPKPAGCQTLQDTAGSILYYASKK